MFNEVIQFYIYENFSEWVQSRTTSTVSSDVVCGSNEIVVGVLSCYEGVSIDVMRVIEDKVIYFNFVRSFIVILFTRTKFLFFKFFKFEINHIKSFLDVLLLHVKNGSTDAFTNCLS